MRDQIIGFIKKPDFESDEDNITANLLIVSIYVLILGTFMGLIISLVFGYIKTGMALLVGFAGVTVSFYLLKKHLLKLDPEQYEYFTGILESVWRDGFVEFAEFGHQKDVEGVIELPEGIKNDLITGELTIKDLSDPILALGDLSQYNLSEFK